MKDSARIGRIGVLAVGLGIGSAVAALPGIASADPLLSLDATGVANSVDGVASSVAALAASADGVPAAFDPNDFAISINGFTLFHDGTATATSGFGDIAIADGAHSTALAEGGFGDFANADGTSSLAIAGSNIGGATGNNFDFASGSGIGADASAGFNGSFDSASAVGNEVAASAGFGTAAVPANLDSASVSGDLTTATTNPTFASAFEGSNDLAFVVDPMGTIGSQAVAGLGGNFDLAGAMGDDLSAVSTGSDFLVHILPFL